MSSAKAARIHLRIAAEDKALFERAGSLHEETLTEFLVESGRERAERLLADRTHFVLGDADWRAFTAALDPPPRRARSWRACSPARDLSSTDMLRFGDPEPLGPEHALSGFECGVHSLGAWLPEQGRAVGYHALCAASVSRREATPRASRGVPRHPIPAVLPARLAVDVSVQGPA